MTNSNAVDILEIEYRARALRDAYIRQLVTGLVARLRRTTARAAHA